MSEGIQAASERFPRSFRYNPDWILSSASGGANPLMLAEWLSEVMHLQPGMRVLDLGCGRAMSSIFLHREFNVQVWATDLWFSAAENLQRIRDAGAEGGVFPIHSDARQLPFAQGFFDAIVSIDAFIYFGTDDQYLNYLAGFVRPGGRIGIAQVGLREDLTDSVPAHLQPWFSQNQLWCLHSPGWWRQHWGRTGIVDIEEASMLSQGWQHWLEWLRLVSPENQEEIEILRADAGSHLGYIRVVGRRKAEASLSEAIVSVPSQYTKKPLLRGSTESTGH